MSFYVETVKRKNGKRYRIVHDETRNGLRKRKYMPLLPEGTTKKKANEICNQMATEASYGGYLLKESITLEEYAEQVFFPTYTTELSPTTQDHYRQLFYTEGGIKDRLGSKYFAEITTSVLQDMINDYNKMGKSPKTIRNIMSLVSVIFRYAKLDNYIKRDTPNPREFLKLPKMVSKEGNVYTMEQITMMLRRAEETQNLNIQLLLALTCFAGGLRRSELVGLRWEDITLDKDNSYIMVRRAEVYANGKVNVKTTKTKAGQRIIPISAEGLVYEILTKARKQYLKEQSQSENFQGDNHVFILHHEPYCPLKPNRLYKIYESFLNKECPDLPRYRLHDLRHTYFTWCSDVGASELSITATGGHSTIQSTKRYQHATMERMRSDMEKLENVFEDVRRKA